jgi:hypothetical protein
VREYLRRLPGHPAHAGDVQEESQVIGVHLAVTKTMGALR